MHRLSRPWHGERGERPAAKHRTSPGTGIAGSTPTQGASPDDSGHAEPITDQGAPGRGLNVSPPAVSRPNPDAFEASQPRPTGNGGRVPPSPSRQSQPVMGGRDVVGYFTRTYQTEMWATTIELRGDAMWRRSRRGPDRSADVLTRWADRWMRRHGGVRATEVRVSNLSTVSPYWEASRMVLGVSCRAFPDGLPGYRPGSVVMMNTSALVIPFQLLPFSVFDMPQDPSR